MIAFASIFGTAQNTQEYYLGIKSGHDLGPIQKTINNDGTISITSNNNSFSSFINAKQVYHFDKAFPGAISTLLQRTYLLILDENEVFTDFMLRNEVEDIELLEKPMLASMYPDEYIELLDENLPNTAMELIKAPLAWTITKGDNSNILVGVVDTKFDLNHEDLEGQIVLNLNDGNSTTHHGTGVASMVAAKTNNGKGMASIGYNTKLVTADFYGRYATRVWEVSQIPGVKVINCSWLLCNYNERDEACYAEIASRGILVVACAANGLGGNHCGSDGNGYAYPASYDSTLSVTSVGSRYDIDSPYSPNGWWYSWKDCHGERPQMGPGGGSHTHNDKVDVCAPGQLVLMATDDYATYPSGYQLGIGTSEAAPIVAGLAALIFDVNPNLTAQEVKDIIKNTADDIYHIPYNQQYLGLLGTGRINAYRAVKTAECMLNPSNGMDLGMQNSGLDDFAEPDIKSQILWESEDIWVRNDNDGFLIKTHQNPKYKGANPNYVYVQVTNSSCQTSSGDDNLKLYWAKSNTALFWPQYWDGSKYIEDPITHEDILMGDEVGTLSIPTLGPGESKILEFQWSVPNPKDYKNIAQLNPDQWGFSLLARIESVDDPMTYSEGLLINKNVKNNNNIVSKNTTVIKVFIDTHSVLSGMVAIGNPYNAPHGFTLEFRKDDNEIGKAIYNEAEVSFALDDVLYDAWQRGGQNTVNVDSTYLSQRKIVAGDHATLNNLQLNANEIGMLNVSFNFLTKELTEKKNYTLRVIQRDAFTNEIIGGETFLINKELRNAFSANAGNDKIIERSESITISAAQINEAAVYNWYDPDGNLIYTGSDLTVSPDVSKKYKLEIISDLDGFKDYDEVKITVNPYKLKSLSPNPATNQVAVKYSADQAASAYIMVISTVTGISNNYILDVNDSNINVDISAYTSGLYSVALVCDGVIVDSKNLAKQ